MKKTVNIDSLFDGFISSAVVGLGSTQNTSLPIVEFAEDIIFNGSASLFPQQSAVLKSFYNEPLNEIETLIMEEWAREDRSNWVTGRQYKNFVLEAGRGSSKALDINTYIPTPSGNRQLKDIEVGDLVLDPSMRPIKVLATTNIMYGHVVYELTFNTGTKVLADAGHLWSMKNSLGLPLVVNTKDLLGLPFTELHIDTSLDLQEAFPKIKPILYIESIKQVESIPVKCIQVEGSNYLCTEDGIPTHNSTLASIICLYEFYSLITLTNPSRHYGLLPNDPIAIFVIAQTLEQVKDTLFAKIKGYASDSLFFKSLADTGKIEILAESIKYPGKNVAIYAKHTNSPALVGYTIKAMILDEFARFQNVVGDGGEITSVGDLLWSNIGNGCNRFGHLGHKVAISSAWDAGDPMERLINDTKEDPQTLTLRLRTWDLNKLPSVSREASNSEYIRNRIKAELEFEGIRRKASAGFISADLCQKACTGNSCIDTTEIPIDVSNEQGDKFYVGIELTRIETDSSSRSFIHVDFSVKRDATALAICHAIEIEPSRWGIQLDGLIRWKPYIDHQGKHRHVSYDNVEFLILELAKNRGASKITFDQFNSESSIQKLHMLGYATQQMSVTRANQLTYYTTFRDLLTQGLLILPKDSIYIATLITELSEVVVKSNGQITHDIAGKDMADAAVNAIYACYLNMINSGMSIGQSVTISKVKSQSIHTLHSSSKASSARLGIGKAISRLHKGK